MRVANSPVGEYCSSTGMGRSKVAGSGRVSPLHADSGLTNSALPGNSADLPQASPRLCQTPCQHAAPRNKAYRELTHHRSIVSIPDQY